MRAVGAFVGSRECEYAADVVRLLELEDPTSSSFAEVEETLSSVPETIRPRLVTVLREAAGDLARVRVPGHVAPTEGGEPSMVEV